jgi:hypothetical protein
VQLTEIERRLGDPEVIQSWGELARIPSDSIPGGIPPATLFASRRMQFLNLQILSYASGRIAAGSDAGNIGTPHGPALHREMELMMEAGMRPFDILLPRRERPPLSWEGRMKQASWPREDSPISCSFTPTPCSISEILKRFSR